MPTIIHYRERCIGCNSCVEHAARFWSMNEKDGKSDLQGAKEKSGVFMRKISSVEVEENKKAERDCPVNIIKVFE